MSQAGHDLDDSISASMLRELIRWGVIALSLAVALGACAYGVWICVMGEL